MQPNELFSEAALIKQINVEDALAVAKYPTSTNFIDVSNMPKFAFLIGAGALNSEIVAQVEQATAANGTPKDVTGATVTIAATGDDKWYLIEVETAQLDTNNDYHFVTLDITGAADSDDYAAIFFIGFPFERPVTQGSDKGEIVYLAG